MTITNSGPAADIPLTGITTVGTPYGGSQSGWTTQATGSTTYTAQSTWPAPRCHGHDATRFDRGERDLDEHRNRDRGRRR